MQQKYSEIFRQHKIEFRIDYFYISVPAIRILQAASPAQTDGLILNILLPLLEYHDFIKRSVDFFIFFVYNRNISNYTK